MPSAVQAKIVQVGNSLGVILPNSLVKDEKLRKGQTVSMSVWKKKKIDLKKFMGLTKGAEPFVRDHGPHD